MSIIRLKFLFISLLCVFFAGTNLLSAQIVIEKKSNDQFGLKINGEDVFIKGAVVGEYMDKVKEYGGNAVRIPCNKNQLEKAGKAGLLAMVGLPFKTERNGFDYNDEDAVNKQQEEVLALARQFKDHPAILFWAIGNEVDFIPPNKPFNPKVWDAINSMALAIKSVDTKHPVLTVIGTSRMYKVADIVTRCPALDLLGLNTYGDIYKLQDTLARHGWNKPYIIAEWGPSGYWEVRKTPWKAPFEQTAAQKAFVYKDKYEKAISVRKGCLGSFVFYWSGRKQETTHTWFNMFDSEGLGTPVIDIMRYLWTGKWPANLAPLVDSINIEGKPKHFIHRLKASSVYTAKAFVRDAENDAVYFKWEIRAEAQYAAYAGQGEKEPQPIAGLADGSGEEIKFTTPSTKGAYRLFVYAYDGHHHSSSANLPFYVE